MRISSMIKSADKEGRIRQRNFSLFLNRDNDRKRAADGTVRRIDNLPNEPTAYSIAARITMMNSFIFARLWRWWRWSTMDGCGEAKLPRRE